MHVFVKYSTIQIYLYAEWYCAIQNLKSSNQKREFGVVLKTERKRVKLWIKEVHVQADGLLERQLLLCSKKHFGALGNTLVY